MILSTRRPLLPLAAASAWLGLATTAPSHSTPSPSPAARMALHAVSPAAASSPLRALSRRLAERPGPLLLPNRLPRYRKFERLVTIQL